MFCEICQMASEVHAWRPANTHGHHTTLKFQTFNLVPVLCQAAGWIWQPATRRWSRRRILGHNKWGSSSWDQNILMTELIMVSSTMMVKKNVGIIKVLSHTGSFWRPKKLEHSHCSRGRTFRTWQSIAHPTFGRNMPFPANFVKTRSGNSLDVSSNFSIGYKSDFNFSFPLRQRPRDSDHRCVELVARHNMSPCLRSVRALSIDWLRSNIFLLGKAMRYLAKLMTIDLRWQEQLYCSCGWAIALNQNTLFRG